jgi:5S rRNA maturation endonuclease (ribonuclease M5)
VHGGDSEEGCCIFTDGNTTKGNWCCWTNHCEEEFIKTMFGFVRGVMSERQNRTVSMNEVAEFCLELIKKDISELEKVEHTSFNYLEAFTKSVERDTIAIERSELLSRLAIPSKYYIGRDYTPEVLSMFDIGECLASNQPMSGRVVVPLYDEDDNYVGCSGRAIKEHLNPKWLYGKGFKKNILYGLNLAKEAIINTGTVVIVEGQGDVWRAFEAGLNMTVGVFGTNLSGDQLILLERSGAINMVVLTDYDDAGIEAAKKIQKKCGRRFNYTRPDLTPWFEERNIPKKQRDLGNMTIEEIKTEIHPYIKGIKNED